MSEASIPRRVIRNKNSAAMYFKTYSYILICSKMGSQLSRQGSQGHGSSGIQQNGSATSVLSDVVIESDPNS